jgi:hypothetical protein
MRTLTFILFLIVCAQAKSQSLQLGVKGGLNISDVVLANFINPDVESDYKIKTGIHLGLYSSVAVAERFALDIEVLYSNKGTNAGERINLHYVNIPFLIRYQIDERVTGAIGPEFGYLFSARSKLGDVSNTWNNKLDFGMDADAQLTLTKKLIIGVRYFAGFSSVIDTRRSGNAGETVKYQNRVLQLSLCYLLTQKD